VPLDSCDADTQGAIGYMIQQSLENEFIRRHMPNMAVAVVTQVEVDARSPAFSRPTKPIGAFMDEATARARAAEEGWTIREDAGRGWRRVVPSPEPLRIVELAAIYALVDAGFVVAAVGGGGIPVVRDENDQIHGVEAVIDKDLASALLANNLAADQLVISTGVDRIRLDFGRPTERALDRLSVAEARQYMAEGHFGAGSMAPKVQAAINYIERGGRRAVVTSPEHLARAVDGQAGTIIEA
jgi:carbamate kinase